MAYTYLANVTSAAVNVSDDQHEEEEDLDIRVIYAMCGIVLILTSVGIISNSFIIYIVLRNRSMRNRPNALVASLAVGDLFVLLVCVPPRAYQMLVFQWPFGTVMCKLSHGSAIVSQAVSILSMVALSHDRYRAIVTPINYPRSRGTSRTFVVIAVIWFLAIVMSIPTIILSHVSTSPYFTWCQYIDHTKIQGQIHAVLRSLLLFFIPLLVISAYYCIVSRNLIGSTRALPGEVHDKRSQISSRKRLAYLVLAIVILFTICWLPSVIFELLFQIDANLVINSNSLTYLKTLSEILTFTNSCINPVLITVVSSTYRNYFASYLCCCYQKARFKRPRNSTISSKASSSRTRITEFA